MEKIIHEVIGVSGFMEFIRPDLDKILRRKAPSAHRGVCTRNRQPTIEKRTVEDVRDAGSLRAFDDQIDERSLGVHLSYDMMASTLYGSLKAIAQDLNEKLKACWTGLPTEKQSGSDCGRVNR